MEIHFIASNGFLLPDWKLKSMKFLTNSLNNVDLFLFSVFFSQNFVLGFKNRLEFMSFSMSHSPGFSHEYYSRNDRVSVSHHDYCA